MSIEIATKVLAKAQVAYGHHTNATKETVRAWADCFEGQKVWPAEAIRAVDDYYATNTFPIMPAHIIAYCKKQPVWSSNEHAWDFLQKWANYPYSTVIEEYTGIPWPEVEPPEDQNLAQERAWLAETRRKWVYENRQVLIGAILSNRHKPLELEG